MLAGLFAAFLSAQTADTATTAWRLQQAGLYREANPFLPHTLPRLVGVKTVYIGGTVALAWHWRTSHKVAAGILLASGTVAGTVAAAHNARVR
jgi:hypothetical protein